MGEKELAGWFRKLGLFTQSPLDYQRISKISVDPAIEGGDITVTKLMDDIHKERTQTDLEK